MPIKASQLPTDIIAGITLAALAIPEVMGYTKIAGTPLINGLYTILIPIVGSIDREDTKMRLLSLFACGLAFAAGAHLK